MPTTLEHESKTWPEFAVDIYDKLAGSDAEVTYEFNDFEVAVPRSFGNDQEHALWKMNGSLSVHMQKYEHKK